METLNMIGYSYNAKIYLNDCTSTNDSKELLAVENALLNNSSYNRSELKAVTYNAKQPHKIGINKGDILTFSTDLKPTEFSTIIVEKVKDVEFFIGTIIKITTHLMDVDNESNAVIK